MFRARSSTSLAPRDFHGMTRLATPSAPACQHCSSSETETVSTMAHHTVDADQWFHCHDCGRYFTTSDDM
jgi:transposase-like protein